LVTPGQYIEGIETKVLPFKTNHGPSAAGSVGYLFETIKDGKLSKVIYTSDFLELEAEDERLSEADILIIQSHWFNEPKINKPFHMSFQRAIDYIIKWNPKTAYLVHFSDGDQVPGDPCNDIMKKTAPKSPLCPKGTDKPYRVPRCGKEWQDVVSEVVRDYGILSKIIVPFDGMIIV
jgi:phosphoribosyl 1,2-cyclic phosphate phosphodiesterase